jgi:hypothetical protein
VNTPSLLELIELFDWDTGKQVWPVPQPSMAAQYAATMVPSHNPAYSEGWGTPAVRERRRQDVLAEQRLISDHYDWMKKQQEERQNREERERFLPQQRQRQRQRQRQW